MSGYDVTEVDAAVSFALLLAGRTEWRNGERRYVFSDTRIDAMVRDEHGEVDAAMALAVVRSGRARLLRAPINRESSCYGKALGYRTEIT